MATPEGHADITGALRNYKVLVDTSFVMQRGFPEFIVENESIIQKNPMLLSRLVMDELQRLSRSKNAQKRDTANRALGSLADLSRRGYVEVRHESSDKYVDLVIQRVVEQHLLNHDFLVLTNDVGLMEDLYAKKQKRSVCSPRDLIVAKLHGASQKLEVFTPNGSRPGALLCTPQSRSCIKPFAASTTLSPIGGSKLHARMVIEPGSRVRLSDGSLVALGEKLAQGGEGAIFEVAGRNEVCKVYHAERLTSDREQKVRLMLTRKLGDPSICWPSALAMDQDSVFRGYVMPRASGQPLAHGLFVPKPWLEANPGWTRRQSVQLAINVLERIQYLHRLNILLGDINPLNILVKGEGTIYFVDCDSYQVEGFPCPVGTVNFTAPEIQKRDFGTFLRRPEHELFAVATLIFMILMPGKTPYSHQGGESGYSNIQQMHFPYPLGEARSDGVPLGPWRFCWSHLTFGIKEAFYKSFHKSPKKEPRVTVESWLKLFRDYEKLLSRRTHTFHGPKRQIGFDLCILPQNLRIVTGQQNVPEDDGQTDMEREFRKLWLTEASHAPPSDNVPKPSKSMAKPQPARTLTHGQPSGTQFGNAYAPPAFQGTSILSRLLKKFF